MASRRIEKISHVIRNTVSTVIQRDLSDPRIEGLVSVTRVEVTPDMRNAQVYLSVLGVPENKQELSLRAVQHAHGFIQGKLGDALQTKVCPALRFHLDNSLKKGAQMDQLFGMIAEENLRRQHDTQETDELRDSEDER